MQATCIHGISPPASCYPCRQKQARDKRHEEMAAFARELTERETEFEVASRPIPRVEKPTKERCDRCGTRFLSTHINDHKSQCDRRFQCPACGMGCHYRELLTHLQSCEGGATCRFCHQKVPKSVSMMAHVFRCEVARSDEHYLDLMDTGLVYGYPRRGPKPD